MPPAGRPRKFDEKRVLNAAMETFWEYGYEATSLAQLREATGLSSASLYGAFSSKAELFRRVVEHYIDGPGQVTELSLRERPAADALEAMLLDSIAMQSEASHPAGCLVALSAVVGAASEDSAAAREAVQLRRQADRDRITACVRAGISDRSLQQDLDPLSASAAVHTFLLGISTQLRDGVDAGQLSQAASMLLAQMRSH
ncbi:TetR family transcriptional regulator [Tamaricihabitans halophyticus]|uniref:TetR family transcriptional regulator n=1 Tax=Tamaricihabitans halophyticus TaxID=1262583 RepID=A0A4R2PTE2_9PSEU|nr:TetR/AcrR family transcriptional regulator [Tamaricihabitans halophyticus]TCP39180.1 TetR family transcriptional regulator [Tamaricihabitans halophyticus]